jgi:hypothetical protein
LETVAQKLVETCEPGLEGSRRIRRMTKILFETEKFKIDPFIQKRQPRDEQLLKFPKRCVDYLFFHLVLLLIILKFFVDVLIKKFLKLYKVNWKFW